VELPSSQRFSSGVEPSATKGVFEKKENELYKYVIRLFHIARNKLYVILVGV